MYRFVPVPIDSGPLDSPPYTSGAPCVDHRVGGSQYYVDKYSKSGGPGSAATRVAKKNGSNLLEIVQISIGRATILRNLNSAFSLLHSSS